MSDQMPDEVYARRIGTWVTAESAGALRLDGSTRYIRADLHDSKACPHVVGDGTQHCALAQDEVEALRAALMRIADYERNWRESGEVALEDVQSMAREALGDD